MGRPKTSSRTPEAADGRESMVSKLRRGTFSSREDGKQSPCWHNGCQAKILTQSCPKLLLCAIKVPNDVFLVQSTARKSDTPVPTLLQLRTGGLSANPEIHLRLPYWTVRGRGWRWRSGGASSYNRPPPSPSKQFLFLLELTSHGIGASAGCLLYYAAYTIRRSEYLLTLWLGKK